MTTSGLFKLNFRDLGKAIALMAIATVLQAILTSISQNGWHQLLDPNFWSATLDLDLKMVGAYLLKNLLTTEDGKILGAIG